MNLEGETIFFFHILSAVVILITSTVLQLKFEGEKKSIYRMTIWTVLAQTGTLFAYFVVFVPYFFWAIYGAFEKNILLLFLAIPLFFFVISTSIGLMLLMKSLRLDRKTEITVDFAKKKMIFQRGNQKNELLNSDVLSIELCGFGMGKMFDFSYFKILKSLFVTLFLLLYFFITYLIEPPCVFCGIESTN